MTPTPSLARASASNHSRSSCRVREPSRRSPRRHRHRRPRSTRGLRPDDSSRKAWFVSQSLTKRAGRNLMLPPCRHEQASRLQLSTLSEWTRAGVPWVRGRRALSREGSSVRARAPSGNRAITTPTELPPMIPVPCAGLLRATAYRVKAIHAERDHPPLAGVPVSDLDVGIDWYTRFFGRPPDSRVGQEFLWEIDERAWLFIEPRGAGGHGPDHSRGRWARRAPRAPRCPAHRARTDRDLLERCPPRERSRSGWERERVRRAARRRERVTSIGRNRGFVIDD
jgi:hypothetical protein